MNYLTSDLHLGHRNILKYCNRPWWGGKDPVPDEDIEAMNAGLIANWNSVVKPSDHVYVLGDFALGKKTRWPEYRRALNGSITLVMGNHDGSKKFMLECGFDEVVGHLDLELYGFKVHLQHFPLGGYMGNVPEPFGNYHYRFCGHIHQAWKHRGSEINVGADVWDYVPRTFSELVRGIKPGDKPELEWKTDYHVEGR